MTKIATTSFAFIELTQPSSEYIVLQAELKRVEQARKLQHDESETHKQFLEKQLQNEVNFPVLQMFVLLFMLYPLLKRLFPIWEITK